MNMDIFDTMLLPKPEHVGQKKTQHCSTVRHSNHFEPQLQTRDNLLAKSPPLLKQQISRKLRQCGCSLGAPPSSKMPGGAWDSMKRYEKHGKATNRSKRIGRKHKQMISTWNIHEYTWVYIFRPPNDFPSICECKSIWKHWRIWHHLWYESRQNEGTIVMLETSEVDIPIFFCACSARRTSNVASGSSEAMASRS